MFIVFDFDGTIAKSTSFHKRGWESALKDLRINFLLEDLLPYEPNLRERFDSYRRIKKGFLDNNLQMKEQISIYFNEKNEDEIVKRIMGLKESATIKAILEEETYSLLEQIALNLTPALIALKSKNIKIGIVSSTRKTIVTSLLIKANLIDFFDVIIGEEDLYEGQILKDKPDSFGAYKLNSVSGVKMDYYIGDNDLIDREFALNAGSKFILADYKSDMLNVINNLL